MNKLFSVHSLENKGFYIPSVDSQLLPECDVFMSLFNFFISTGNRDSYSEGVKKIILGLLLRTFGHILESQSTQKNVYTDILPDPVIRFNKRSRCFEIVS